jgi:hypothetical protein
MAAEKRQRLSFGFDERGSTVLNLISIFSKQQTADLPVPPLLFLPMTPVTSAYP